MQPRLRILVLGAGTLPAQNLVDSLEGRRDCVWIAGANFRPDNPRLFRYDVAYRTPSTGDAPAFRARLRELFALERPDLALAGRDEDGEFLAELAEAEPALAPRIACGPPRFASLLNDKWESFLFCRRHGLPFAETLLAGPGCDAAAARAFVARHGFPLVAKPRRGGGTVGARILFDEAQFARTLSLPGYVVQPFLAPPPGLREKFFDPAEGWPFFFTLTDDGQLAGQAVIGPDGALAGVWCHLCTMISGKPEFTRQVDEPEFVGLTRRAALAAAAEGWRGPYNLPARNVAPGQYVGFELAGRVTGSTSVRRLYGFDEIGLLARSFAGVELPLALPPDAAAGRGRVAKYMSDFYAPDAWVGELEARGMWRAPARA